MHKIDAIMFDKPSGEVRGVVTVFANVAGKEKRLAHATILIDAAPSISLAIPKYASLEEIATITAALTEFSAKVAAVN